MMLMLSIVTTYLLPFIVVLGVLIIAHEAGHFLAAKAFGIRVERFSVGFPPRLFGKQIGETDYCVSAVPLGGYVKLSGMIDESMDTGGVKGEPWEFMSKPVWVRMLVLFAGPLANVLLTIFVFTVSVFITGIPEPVGPIVGRVMENMPAQTAGLQPGDRIVRIDGAPISSWDDLIRIIHASPEKEIKIEWERSGAPMSALITPKLDKMLGYGLVGIDAKTINVRPGFFKGMAVGWQSTWNLTRMMFRSFGMLFSGDVSVKEGLAGPVRIAQMTGETAKAGFGSLVMFMALLSLNLGIINLFPIPALDGGHLLLLAYEGVTRKPISTKVRLVVQQIGMAMLLALMLFVIFNDFVNIF
ncbi:MAG TPA: RIP metalloprotease RseP [bacterium]|nr:RIP metalloprotease RseP [bacterium]HPG84088.1 RIP metalloprotease RseP [bacterium]HPM59388.1 RIP metalloprotease RseP [bacterium]